MRTRVKLLVSIALLVLVQSLWAVESYTINVGYPLVVDCTASIPTSDYGVTNAVFSLVDESNSVYLSISQSGSTWCTLYGYYPKENIKIKVTCYYTVNKMPYTYLYYIYVTVNGINPTSISIEKPIYTTNVKETIELTVGVLPTNADTRCWWSIDDDFGNPSYFEIVQNYDEKNAKVKVTPNKAGECRISVKTLNNLVATCIVEAIDIDATDIKLEYSSLTLQKGDSYKLAVSLLPKNATSAITWKSDKTSVAKVSNGTITAVAEGAATITATTANGLTTTCIVTVIPVVLSYKYDASTSTAIVINCDNSQLKSNSTLFIPASTKSNSKTYNVTTIGASAFHDCTALAEVIIPYGVKTIEDNAFEKCTSLKKVSIPNTLNEVGMNVFEGCYSIENPIFNKTLYLFMPKYNGTNTYEIPEGIKRICYAAFQDNYSIKTIKLPSTLTQIDDKAFNGSNISNITILATTPPYCKDYGYSTTLHQYTECFSSTQYNGTLLVPAGCVDAYKNSNYCWHNFTYIREMGQQPVDFPENLSTLTCSQAVKYARQLEVNDWPTEQRYFINGYVTQIIDKSSAITKSFWMADTPNGGNVIEVVKGMTTDDIEVGDSVSCFGALMRHDQTAQISTPLVILKERSPEKTINFLPDYVKVLYYQQYDNLHSLDMYTIENNSISELVRIYFYPDEVGRINGWYMSILDKIVISENMGGYYKAETQSWERMTDADLKIYYQSNVNGSDYKVYKISGTCDLVNGKRLKFSFEDIVYPSTRTIVDDEPQYSEYVLLDGDDYSAINTDIEQPLSRKVIENGVLYIYSPNGTRYNILGYPM